MSQRFEIPFWEKYILTVKEAAQYFTIGENKLRQIINDNEDAPYILHNGGRTLIKRLAFERFLDKSEYI